MQKHRATALHYDFRLEAGGVLVSWAVPKGPSLNPADKRLAMAVEDHPLEYAEFEGDIPAGEYGAGHVDIWDRGTWTPIGDPHAGLRDGHLRFELAGNRLRGRWALIRMKRRDNESRDNWLLLRERDAAAEKSATRTTRASVKSRAKSAKAEMAGVAISNPDRVIAESGGVTKLDVARYYFDVAKWLMPHVRDRPLAVVKCPGGDLSHCFFQRHPGQKAVALLSPLNRFRRGGRSRAHDRQYGGTEFYEKNSHRTTLEKT